MSLSMSNPPSDDPRSGILTGYSHQSLSERPAQALLSGKVGVPV